MCGVDQVGESESMFKSLQYLFKEREQLHVPTKWNHWLGRRDAEQFKIKREIRSDGVKPMDCPRVLYGGAINVRRTRRDNQQLVSRQFVRSFLYLAPPVAAGTVNENRFRTSSFSGAGMAFGFGVIPGISRNESLEQRVL